jgi:hypothetical protein
LQDTILVPHVGKEALTTVADLSGARAGADTNIVLNRLETKRAQDGTMPCVNCLLLCEMDDSRSSNLYIVNNRMVCREHIVVIDWIAA